MGTHPIFESDFDCLTEMLKINRINLSRYSSVIVTNKPNGISVVELKNKPVNLLTKSCIKDIISTFSNISNNDQINGVILKSGCPGIFTAGLDIGEIYNRSDEQIFDYWSQLQQMWITLYSCSLPVIAQINGTCPAAGCLMACSADYRIMENNKKFKIGLNETQLGFAAPDWLCWLYQDIIGKREGELHLQLGSLFSPEEAFKLGLVDQIVESSNKLEIKAEEEVLKFIKIPKKAFQTTKETLRKDKVEYLLK